MATMRSWRVDELGHPSKSLRLRDDVDVPEPGEGQVRISVEAGNINFADILLCQGIYQERPGVPLTPGLETCGRINAVGPGVGLEVGIRIAGMAALPYGGYAEQALVKAHTAVPVPDDVDSPSATVLFSTFQTAHVGIHYRGQLKADEWLLVNGASSGVGAAAVQLGAAAGARVIATASTEAKRQHCTDLGAHFVFDAGSDSLRDDIMAITEGHGVDVAFDPVGGTVGEVTRRVMAWEGRLIVIGFASGEIPSYPGNHLLVKNYSAIGLYWGAYSDRGFHDIVLSAHADLMEKFQSGVIRADVTKVYALEDVLDALDALESRTVTGRLVVAP